MQLLLHKDIQIAPSMRKTTLIIEQPNGNLPLQVPSTDENEEGRATLAHQKLITLQKWWTTTIGYCWEGKTEAELDLILDSVLSPNRMTRTTSWNIRILHETDCLVEITRNSITIIWVEHFWSQWCSVDCRWTLHQWRQNYHSLWSRNEGKECSWNRPYQRASFLRNRQYDDSKTEDPFPRQNCIRDVEN